MTKQNYNKLKENIFRFPFSITLHLKKNIEIKSEGTNKHT